MIQYSYFFEIFLTVNVQYHNDIKYSKWKKKYAESIFEIRYAISFLIKFYILIINPLYLSYL